MKKTASTFERLVRLWLGSDPPTTLRLTRSHGKVRAYFEGDVLYSCPHWPLARRIYTPPINKNVWSGVVLINVNRYSNTASRQARTLARMSSRLPCQYWEHAFVKDIMASPSVEAERRLKVILDADAKVMARPTNIRGAYHWFQVRASHLSYYETFCRKIVGTSPQLIPLSESLLPVYYACQLRYPDFRTPVAVA